MSIGGLLGAIAGGVIGFFIGGFQGAFLGASLGFSLGMAIDPIRPDVKTPGAPIQPLQLTTNEIGAPIPELLGTGKILGHLLLYGKERVEEITEEVEGGKGGDGGGSQTVVTGHRYYASWAVGICLGPIDTAYSIYKDEKLVWDGVVDRPVSGGVETIAIPDMGNVYFYFGTDDQVANSKVGEIIGDDSLNSPWRGLCWAFFDDCLMGNYNRMPVIRFVVRKTPELSFSDKNVIQSLDYNPAHAIWYILNRSTGLSEDWLHATDFATIADDLYTENRGISMLLDHPETAETILETINVHIDNIIKYGNDAKFHPKLIRNDYVVADLPLIDEDIMLDEPTFQRKSWIDTINEIKTQYSEITREECLFWNSPENVSMASGYYRTSVYVDGVYSCGYKKWYSGGYQHKWTIDKRNKDTGEIIWEQDCFGETGGFSIAYGIRADVSGVYVIGKKDISGGGWIIQKRSRATGALIWEQYGGAAGQAFAVTIDSNYVYVTGYKGRIEKRNKSDGELVTAAEDASYDVNFRGICAYGDSVYATGFCQNTYGWRTVRRLKSDLSLVWAKEYNFYDPGYNVGYGIWADSTGVYVAGSVESMGPAGQSQWAIEKRELGNGDQVWGVIYDPAPGAYDVPFGVVGDSTHIYIGGWKYGGTWLVNKRLKSDGSFVWAKFDDLAAGGNFGCQDVALDECGVYAAGGDEIPGGTIIKRITKRNYSTGDPP